MPEGPTLVVFAKQLKKFEGKTVTESGGYRNPYADDISGKIVLQIETYGKYLILQFDEFFVTVHFGLFGSFLINDFKKVNASFSLHFGEEFINFYVVNVNKHGGKFSDFYDEELNVFSANFNAEKVRNLLLNKFPKKKIGDVLMNQDLFPGLGNVIRNEVLFFAKINPESIVEKIPAKKINDLLGEISTFSKASVELIEKKIWKSSASVYGKKMLGKEEVKMYVSQAIKRKTYFVESVQKLYD